MIRSWKFGDVILDRPMERARQHQSQMAKQKPPITLAIRELRKQGVKFDFHLYRYEEGGGTALSARELGVHEHQVIKTLIMEDDRQRPLIVVMHGDLEVSTRSLARQIDVKSVTPCDPVTADRHSGYQIGGTSPFGTRRRMPVYCERSILDLPLIYINGGKRGFLVSMVPGELTRVLDPRLVTAAQ